MEPILRNVQELENVEMGEGEKECKQVGHPREERGCRDRRPRAYSALEWRVLVVAVLWWGNWEGERKDNRCK